MAEYEYEFVRIEVKTRWKGTEPAEDYQHIVHDRARKGWRLVTMFAPGFGAYGTPKYIELVFERER